MKFIPSTCWLTWMFMSLVFPVSFVYGAQGQLTIKTPRPAVTPTSPVSPRLPEPLVKPVPRPDLTVESLGWSMPVKQGDRIGSSSQLVISVKNKGQVASGPFNIKISVSGTSVDQSILSGLNGTLPCPALGSKMSRTLKWPEPSAMVWPSGSFSVTAEVDDGSLKINPERANARRVLRFTVLPSGSFLHPAPQINLSPGKTIKPSEKVGINPQPEPPLPKGSALRSINIDHKAGTAISLKPGEGKLISPSDTEIKTNAKLQDSSMTRSPENDFAKPKDGLEKPMGKLEGTLNGKINGKSVSEIAGGCDKIIINIYDKENQKLGTVHPVDEGGVCRYTFMTPDPSGCRLEIGLAGYDATWTFRESPADKPNPIENNIGMKKNISAEINAFQVMPQVSASMINFPGNCPENRIEGRIFGSVNGKSIIQLFGGCDKIPVEIYDYYHNKTGSTSAVPDGDGQNCRYCFSVSKPMYYAAELPTFINNYDCYWKTYYIGGNEGEEAGQPLINKQDLELVDAHDLNGPERPDLRISHLVVTPPGVGWGDRDLAVYYKEAADFIYTVTNDGTSRAQPFKVTLSWAGIPIASNEHSTLEPGKTSSRYHLVWPAILCNTDVSLTVDPDHRINESNENNNSSTKRIECCDRDSLYDLEVVVPPQSPVTISPMGFVQFTYIVENDVRWAKAGAPATKVDIKVYASKDNRTVIGSASANIPAIPLISQTVSQQYVGTFLSNITSSNNYIEISVDPDNNISEIVLFNNIAGFTASNVTIQ